MSDQLKATAYAVLTVVAVYFLAVAIGRIGSSWPIFLPIDILMYLGIGFFSTRALQSWRGGLVVVLIAAFVDGLLAIASLILPRAPHLGPSQVAIASVVDYAANVVLGIIGIAIGAIIGGSAKRPPH